MDIKAFGYTVKDNSGETQLILKGDLPSDCFVVFISKEDWDEACKLLRIYQAKD